MVRLTVKEVAEYLRVNRWTVTRWCQDGLLESKEQPIPGGFMRLIPRSAVLNFKQPERGRPRKNGKK